MQCGADHISIAKKPTFLLQIYGGGAVHIRTATLASGSDWQSGRLGLLDLLHRWLFPVEQILWHGSQCNACREPI